MKKQLGFTAYVIITFLSGALLSGCASRNLNALPFQGGYGSCQQSSLGQFEVTLTASQSNPGDYTIQVYSGMVPNPGQNVSVQLANSSYSRPLVTSTMLQQNQLLYQGTITPQDLSLFQLVAIGPSSIGQTSFMNNTNSNLEICDLPSVSTQSPVY